MEAGRAGAAHGAPRLGVNDRADGVGAARLVFLAEVPAGRAGILIVEADVHRGDLTVIARHERAEDAAVRVGAVLVHDTPQRVFRGRAAEPRVALKPRRARASVFVVGDSARGADGTWVVVGAGVLALAVDAGLEALAVQVRRALHQLAGHLWVP